jgi:hypothetical protein
VAVVMPQEAIINQGTWAALTYPVDETNLKVQSVKWKPAREKIQRKGPSSRAVEKLSYRNPTMTITIDAEVSAQTTFGSMAIGRAATAGLANFSALWREHDPEEGVVILEDVEDSADVTAEVDLTTTLTFMHYPKVA